MPHMMNHTDYLFAKQTMDRSMSNIHLGTPLSIYWNKKK